MTSDTVQALAKYVVAVIVIVGSFVLLAQAAAGADTAPEWGTIGIIVGWIVRDSAGQSATTNAVKITAAAQTPPAA